MIKVLLIYLLIGVVIMFLLEIFWDLLETELESELELNTVLRLEVILLWPILVIAVILSLLGNDGENNRPGYTS